MKHLILPLSAGAYDPKHLKQLKEPDQFPKCDLEEAYLRGAYLRGAYLEYVTLWKANLKGANLKGATFCNTTMPDGSVNNSDSVYTPDCE